MNAPHSIPPLGAVFALLLLGPAALVSAQDGTRVAGMEATATKSLKHSLLERPARLQVRDVTLTHALTELRRQAAVPLVFSDDFLPRGTTVSCDCVEIPVRAALDRLLAGTGLQYLELRTQVVIEPGDDTSNGQRMSEGTAPALTSSTPLLDTGTLRTVTASKPSPAPRKAPRRRMVGTVLGSVVDGMTGRPLASVAVRIPALDLGVFTNQEGNFRIAGVPAGVHEIRASRLGYGTVTQEVTVSSGEVARVEFRLEESAITLDEMVVTGYGVSQRRDRTGSLSQLDAATIELSPIQTLEQVLQGRAAGVQVSSVSGQPGGGPEVRIRGIGSITAGNRPLYIVDGVQVSERELGNAIQSTDASLLAGVNPRDIESIEILKDAAAASIYGAQAANGVVLITTRRGQAGETQWSFSSEIGTVETLGRWDVLRADEWVTLQMEAYGNRSEDLGQPRSQGEQQAAAIFGHPSEVQHYDWQGAVLQRGALRSFATSASGGTQETRFFLSGAYDYEEGQLVRTDFDRLTLRANLEHQASERLSILTKLGLARVEQNGTVPTTCANCPLNYTVQVRPTSRIYNEDGSFNQSIGPIPYSPVFQAFNEVQQANNHTAMGNLTANYAITPRLNFRSLFGVDYRARREKRYRPPEQPFIGDFLQEVHRGVMNWNTNQVLNYTTTLGAGGAHNVSTLAGVEYRHESAEVFSAIGAGLPSGFFNTLSLASVPRSNAGYTGGFKLASGFGRVQYDFQNRYMATLSLRYDGSSRFGDDYRWGTFYSGSVGWDLAQEPFMRGADWLDDLTVRASYGVTGNSNIDDFASLNLFGSGGQYARQPALRPIQLGNNLLTWEEARTINLGAQWSALAGRLFGSIDLFRTNNANLLLNAFLPADAGFGGILRNTGEVRNQGLELEVGGTPYAGTGLSWNTRFTIAWYDNEIVSLVDGLENIGSGIRVGHPLRIYWGARWAGVNPADGRPMWYDADGNITYQVTSADQQFLGSPLPDVEGGWNNTLSYGPLSLDAFLQFSLGLDVHDSQYPTLLNVSSTGGLSRDVLQRWQGPGDVTNVPRAYTSNAHPGTSPFTTFSDRFIYDGSYVRLKTLTLRYDLPARLMGRAGFNRGSIYAQGFNLWTATEYPGIDPEVQALGDTTWPGTRQYRFGIRVLP